jgi:signal transduction histidine kinase
VTRRSLRARLLLAAIGSISAALVAAGLGFVALFEHHVERRIGAELETHLNQIIANLALGAGGRISLAQAPAEPRFERPLSGLYWQIQDEARPTLLRSRSLWDAVIELPSDEAAPGAIHRHTLAGPADQTLLVRERQIILRPEAEARRVRITVAVDRRELIAARNAFAADILPYLALLAGVLVLAAWLQVRIGLVPLDALRRGVMAIRSGAQRRLSGQYPEEVMPLVEEMNGLLDAQERAIERARAWTADLAHGLKTPLMVLTADAQRLREQGNTPVADDLDQLAETMRRRIDRELIRARVRSQVQTRQARVEVGEAVERIVRTLRRTPRGAQLDWTIQVPERLAAAMLPDDLAELLGNLLENATQWADKGIAVSVSGNGRVEILIEDDGPGVPDDQLEKLGLRGVRLDERTQGSGLGLAIARDITEAYGGKLHLHHAAMGGLAVALRLPLSS